MQLCSVQRNNTTKFTNSTTVTLQLPPFGVAFLLLFVIFFDEVWIHKNLNTFLILKRVSLHGNSQFFGANAVVF